MKAKRKTLSRLASSQATCSWGKAIAYASSRSPVQLPTGEALGVDDFISVPEPRIALVWVSLRGLEGLGALLQFGGFFVAPKLAQGLGFRGKLANKIRAVRAELLFLHGQQASVTGRGFVRLAPLIVEIAKIAQGYGQVQVLFAVIMFVNTHDTEHEGFALGKVLFFH